jgi:hypothetical protein
MKIGSIFLYKFIFILNNQYKYKIYNEILYMNYSRKIITREKNYFIYNKRICIHFIVTLSILKNEIEYYMKFS